MFPTALLWLVAGCKPPEPPPEKPPFYPDPCLETEHYSRYEKRTETTSVPMVIHLYQEDRFARDYEFEFKELIDAQVGVLRDALSVHRLALDLKPLQTEPGRCDTDALYDGDMRNTPQVQGAIDVFYCADPFSDPEKENVAGFASATRHGMVTMHNWLEEPSVLGHEVGHSLGLLHTFEDKHGDGAEYVDGSNALTAGDFLSDTPAEADPTREETECEVFAVDCPDGYRYGEECFDFDCPLDANGDEYHPDPTNLLSYHKAADRFSAEQAAVMACTLAKGDF